MLHMEELQKEPQTPTSNHLSTFEHSEQIFWKILYPIFPWFQKILLKFHIIWHTKGRQRYHIGWLRKGATLTQFKEHLSSKWNFGNHFVAWKDDDQVLSWRRLASFEEQWHLRVYSDGEIRGHYERTPEAAPVKHFTEVGEVDRTSEFKEFCGDFCVDTKSPMHLTRDITMTDPESEITLAKTIEAEGK